MVGGILDEGGAAVEGTDKPADCVRIFLRPARAQGQHLLGGVRQDFAREMQNASHPEIDRDRVPGRSDAEAVDLRAGEAFHHIGRRQHYEAHILIGIDAGRRHPEPQLIIVGRERKGHTEGERLLAAALSRGDDVRKCARRHHRVEDAAVGSLDQFGPKARRESDGIAVHAEPEGCHDRHLDMPKS